MKKFFKTIIVSILTLEARLVLRKYRPNIVAVTGSVGKTTTKDAIYTALGARFFVRKSDKSFNSDIGIPLSILGCPNGWSNPLVWIGNMLEGLALILLKNHYPRWIVLEIGADRPGDIKSVASWLTPHVVVVTRLPSVPVHVEFFDSPEAVYAEKKYIVDALSPEGIAVLNSDDDNVMRYKKDIIGSVVTFGFLKGANIKAAEPVTVLYEHGVPSGIQVRIDCDGRSLPIRLLGVIGRQHVYAALAAIAVGVSQGVNLVAIAAALQKHAFPPGRMRLIDGIKETTIIDDSYNASPASVTEALRTLKEMNTSGRKIAMLGDMLELGQFSVDEHKKAGKDAAESCDMLIVVGIRARHIAESALAHGMSEKSVRQYDDARRAGKELEFVLKKGDVVLVKGSAAMRMERAVGEIMLRPTQKQNLLVRQETAWLKKT